MKTVSQLLPVLFLVSLFSCTKEPSFEIKGKINVGSGTIYLKSFRNKMFFLLDSAIIKDSSFIFKGTTKYPDLYGITLDSAEQLHPYFVFVENTKINVEIDTSNHREAKVTGSKAHDLFVEFYKKRKEIKIDSFISQNSKSTVAAYILFREYATRLTPEELEKNIALFDSSLNEVPYLTSLKAVASLKRNVEIGKPFIDFTSLSPEGKEIKLSDYLGNYLLIDFWASWCVPCRKENPVIVSAYRKFKDKGFNIFAVSLDKSKENWVKAIESDSLSWVHVSDLKFWDSAPAKLYAVRNIPSNILIDPSGTIIARNLRGEELEKKLDELYAKTK